jgi:hypothetical protein
MLHLLRSLIQRLKFLFRYTLVTVDITTDSDPPNNCDNSFGFSNDPIHISLHNPVMHITQSWPRMEITRVSFVHPVTVQTVLCPLPSPSPTDSTDSTLPSALPFTQWQYRQYSALCPPLHPVTVQTVLCPLPSPSSNTACTVSVPVSTLYVTPATCLV